MADKNVLILAGDLASLDAFESTTAARKALKAGAFGEGTFNIVTLHERASIHTESVQKVQVDSQVFRSRAPRKRKAQTVGVAESE